MSATIDRPAPGRADGLELLGTVSGSGYKEGAALVRRADGQMVQLGPLLYALLEAIDAERDRAALADAVTERLGRRLEPDQVDLLAAKLAKQGLLAGSEEHAPPRMNPLLALRWKVLITDPKVTDRITAPFTHLFRPWLLVPLLAGFAVVFWFVLIHKGVAAATAQAFGNPELILLVLGLAVASAAFHEIGHAAACRFGGGRAGGMGAGIYMVWPAFYTDVTDAYRLSRRARLRTDLGGIYFNAVIAVVTLAVWYVVRADALLLLIALQMLEMVKNLSPIIRADGYHVLADATGVPDLYAHIGPTLKRLLPWKRREPSALTGRARVFVTAWVLVIVPILTILSLSAIVLLPKLAASTWESGSHILSGLGDGGFLHVLTGIVRLLALALPVMGVVLMAERLVRSTTTKALRWSAGRPGRRAALVAATAVLAGVLVWAWWPSGQYQPVRASDRGTLVSAVETVPQQAARPPAPVAVSAPASQAQAKAKASVRLTPGKHLAVALLPHGGPTKEHPAIFVVKGRDKHEPSVVIVSEHAPSADTAPIESPTATPAPATAFPIKLPDKPGPHESQALAVNDTDGGIVYDVVYSLVTVENGRTIDDKNSAYALASCKACMTVAVSFQIVLVVGQSDVITPINVAEALNVNCPACITTAIADQIVITVGSKPSDELLRRLTEALRKLDAIDDLGAGGTPAAVAAIVAQVHDEIEQELATGEPTQTPTATASPSPEATETATPAATASETPTATASPEPTATPTETPESEAEASPTPTP